MWLWWTTILHGLTTELVSYWAEPIDNFWHSQSTFMFFGQREPLHIMCLYPGYVYTASVAVSRLGLSELSSACAIGLFVVLFDLPYDIIGVKLLWWSWHDTDANIRDRHYWVPWTSYYFHLTFACSFDLIYQKAKRYFVGISGIYSADEIQRMPYAQQRRAENWRGELKASVLTGLCAMPFGILQFVPGYHIFKDVFGVHAEVTTMLLMGLYGVVLMYGFQHARPVNIKELGEREERRGDKKSGRGRWYIDEVYVAMCMHYLHYAMLVVVGDPGNKQVLGLHQPMGAPIGSGTEYDCDQFRNLSYPYPFTPAAFWPFEGDMFESVTVWKRPYVCPGGELMDERYIGFTCPKAQSQEWVPNNQWYWYCGTDWEDGSGLTHVEYILVVWGLCFLGFNVYTQALCYPRNIFEQFFVLKEFPRYYKTDKPSKVVSKIIDDRVGEDGRQEVLVSQLGRGGKDEGSVWIAREDLVQDCTGPVYGERGGLYGTLPDTYGGSSRDRLRVYDSYKHAMERLKLADEYAENRRMQVSGINYRGAVPSAAGPVLRPTAVEESTMAAGEHRRADRSTLRQRAK